MDAMSVDMDPSSAPANTATSLGSRQSCARINENNTLDADEDATADRLQFDITASGVPAPGMIAWTARLIYDEATFSVFDSSVKWKLNVNPGSSLLNASDPVPDSDLNNSYVSGALDNSVGAPETGDGVLSRLVIETDSVAVAGIYPLILDALNSVHIDSDVDFHYPVAFNDALAAVNVACSSPQSDVKLVSVTNDLPPQISTAPRTVSVTAVAHNNGPDSGARVVFESAVPGCSASSGLVNWFSLPVSANQTHNYSLSIHCTHLGPAQFVTCVLAGPDTNQSNNCVTTPFDVVEPADRKVTGISLVAPSQIQSGQPFGVSVSGTLHNNGPYNGSPIHGAGSISLATPPSCTPVNPVVAFDVTLLVSVTRNISANFTLTCTIGGTIGATIALDPLPYVTDPVPANDSRTTQKSVVTLDTDEDGVDDNIDRCLGTHPLGIAVDANGCADYQVDADSDGICDPNATSGGPSGCIGSDNCPNVPNPGQQDTDGDGIADACESQPPIAVGGTAGLTHPPASGGVDLPWAALVAIIAVMLGGSAFCLSPGRRKPH